MGALARGGMLRIVPHRVIHEHDKCLYSWVDHPLINRFNTLSVWTFGQHKRDFQYKNNTLIIYVTALSRNFPFFLIFTVFTSFYFICKINFYILLDNIRVIKKCNTSAERWASKHNKDFVSAGRQSAEATLCIWEEQRWIF